MTDISRRDFLAGAAVVTATGALATAGVAQAFAADAASGSASASKSASASASASAAASGSASASVDAAMANEYAGGTATVGTGMGKHGSIEIEVVTDGGQIKRINILESRETAGIGDVCMDKLSKLIVDNQTLNVDSVAGATLSSSAFLTAVAAALDAAGEDSSEWANRDHAVQAPADDIPTDADVVVIGAGGAGFASAITAANLGKSVILIEKLGYFGGSTALSGGEMAVPNNWIQVNEGIEDSPELLASDMLAGGDNKGDPDLVNVIANGVFDAAQWLTYEGGVSWEHDLLFFGGHSVKRSIIPSGHIGNAMTTKLTARARKIDNITLLDNTKATELVKADDGSICGVKAENTITGDTYEFTCKAVILTSGGFGANAEMRAKYNPDFGDQYNSTDAIGAQGDGLVMASAIGAELIDMDLIQTYPICDIQTGALIYLDDMRLDGRTIMFNLEGDRFVEELDRRDVLSKAILAQTGGVAYEIWDQKAADDTDVVNIHSDEFENMSSRGLCVKADTLEDACAPFGIDATELQKTLDRWNGFCDEGKDEDFNYRADLVKIETPPYYIIVYKPAVHYTMGGLHINVNAEVLDESGNVIPGLFAAGEVAGHKMGTNRLGSTSMADIYTFGRVAGNSAASYIG